MLGLVSSPLLTSSHRVVMTLQPFARASFLGTFVYTPILRKNFTSSFLASAVKAWFNVLPVVSSKNSMSAYKWSHVSSLCGLGCSSSRFISAFISFVTSFEEGGYGWYGVNFAVLPGRIVGQLNAQQGPQEALSSLLTAFNSFSLDTVLQMSSQNSSG